LIKCHLREIIKIEGVFGLHDFDSNPEELEGEEEQQQEQEKEEK